MVSFGFAVIVNQTSALNAFLAQQTNVLLGITIS